MIKDVQNIAKLLGHIMHTSEEVYLSIDAHIVVDEETTVWSVRAVRCGGYEDWQDEGSFTIVEMPFTYVVGGQGMKTRQIDKEVIE